MPDFLRLAIGTLTVVRVPAPRRVDERVARSAMLVAPFVGALLGLAAAVALDGTRFTSLGGREAVSADLLGAALALVVLAWLTRGIHLDGLADTFDGFGVKGDDDDAQQRRLEVMRRPDVGAFGVVAVVLVLLVDAAALTACALTGRGTVSVVTAAMVSRLAMTWCCTRGVPAARQDGLGRTVAGTVPVLWAAVLTLVVLEIAAGLAILDDDAVLRDVLRPRSLVWDLVLASIAGLVAGWLVRRRAVTRFGGVTGDVLGAAGEISFAATLVVAALLA
jgi:adenosylcobinamide-GDP ribazoletransferase